MSPYNKYAISFKGGSGYGKSGQVPKHNLQAELAPKGDIKMASGKEKKEGLKNAIWPVSIRALKNIYGKV